MYCHGNTMKDMETIHAATVKVSRRTHANVKQISGTYGTPLALTIAALVVAWRRTEEARQVEAIKQAAQERKEQE